MSIFRHIAFFLVSSAEFFFLLLLLYIFFSLYRFRRKSIDPCLQHRKWKLVHILPNEKSSPDEIGNDFNCFVLSFRRHTLNVQKVTPPPDGINYNRRQSLGNGRRLSFQAQEITESSKSKTNLRNFYVFFVSLFLFIFLAVVYSFIRMIKNQAS